MSIPATVTQLIEGSGNNFHAKVARWFNADGWHTIVSPYYLDQSQSKTRELDLIVEKLWPIESDFGQHAGNVVVRLFVECKFVATEAAFWFAPKNIDAATSLVCRSGLFRKNNIYTQKHHYLSNSPAVAKLFASNNGRTSENEPFFKALNQALSAMVAMQGQPVAHPSLQGRPGGKLVVLDFPVVVCSSFAQMYAVDFLSESDPSLIEENFQLEVQYAFMDRARTEQNSLFFLDFVEFSQLSEFRDAVGESAKAAAFFAD